jgi:hypothetical protein
MDVPSSSIKDSALIARVGVALLIKRSTTAPETIFTSAFGRLGVVVG